MIITRRASSRSVGRPTDMPARLVPYVTAVHSHRYSSASPVSLSLSLSLSYSDHLSFFPRLLYVTSANPYHREEYRYIIPGVRAPISRAIIVISAKTQAATKVISSSRHVGRETHTFSVILRPELHWWVKPVMHNV